jgi:hypothetical protein
LLYLFFNLPSNFRKSEGIQSVILHHIVFLGEEPVELVRYHSIVGPDVDKVQVAEMTLLPHIIFVFVQSSKQVLHESEASIMKPVDVEEAMESDSSEVQSYSDAESSSAGGPSTRKSEPDEALKILSAEEQRTVRSARITVFLVFMLCAIAVSVAVYFFATKSDESNYEIEVRERLPNFFYCSFQF